MEWLRKALAKLGWPVESLSDQEVAEELHARWRACCPAEPDTLQKIGSAAAMGIFITMAEDGNLDALCWSVEGDPPVFEQDALDELELLDRPSTSGRGCGAPRQPERRRSVREPARDLIEFGEVSDRNSASGWLVDTSRDGIAFIAETRHVPAVGTRILSTIDQRDGTPIEFGLATVVRTELLDDTLSLVCAQRQDDGEQET